MLHCFEKGDSVNDIAVVLRLLRPFAIGLRDLSRPCSLKISDATRSDWDISIDVKFGFHGYRRRPSYVRFTSPRDSFLKRGLNFVPKMFHRKRVWFNRSSTVAKPGLWKKVLFSIRWNWKGIRASSRWDHPLCKILIDQLDKLRAAITARIG